MSIFRDVWLLLSFDFKINKERYMIIQLKKIGTTLIGRPAGKEALNAIKPALGDIGPDENVEIDFSGVLTFSPSWGDEFLSSLFDKFGDRLILMPSDNPSVKASLEIIEKTSRVKFNIINYRH